MAARRMFSPEVIRKDDFLDMAPSTQALYFHLGMEADDDGFVTPRMIMRQLGSTADELKVLLAKGFVISFETGVIVITHWRRNNQLRKQTYRPTQYQAEFAQMALTGHLMPYRLKSAITPASKQLPQSQENAHSEEKEEVMALLAKTRSELKAKGVLATQSHPKDIEF